MSEEDKALQDAQSSGQPVELLSARTEASDTWALPDGSFSVKRHGTAVRLWRDGAWVAADPTLQFTADGSVMPKASSVAVKFSGGGSGAMLSGVKDGRTLSLAWPKTLPKPTLSSNIATYSEILPGVDLQLKAEVEGFSQLLVVKTAAAAQNPELAKLQFAMNTVGLKVAEDVDTGTLVATDPAGQTVFTSPAPLMWDSSTLAGQLPAPAMQKFAAAASEPTPGDAFEPGVGAEDAQMDTSVSSDTLTITPDQALLTGAETTYPVFIDPSWAWGEWQHWTRVYKAYPKISYWDAKGDVRVGYEEETGGSDRISRSFFQLDTSDVTGAQIKSATFRIRNTWSWSCSSQPVELFQVGDISRKTNWNNQPGKIGSALDVVNDSKGWGPDCPAGNLEFNATSAVRTAAAGNDASVTLGLYAGDEGETRGWKRFDPKTATLEIKYNKPPKTPSGLGTNPRSSCTAGGAIGNTTVSLHAKIDDPDGGNLTAQFQAFKTGTTAPVVDTTIPALKGRVATVVLPSASTPTGAYTWRVRAKDPDDLYSAWSATCKFSLDRTRPSKPPIITSQGDVYPSGDEGWPAQTGPARSQGTFVFASNGVQDVESYYWWTDSDPDVRQTKASVASALIVPPSYGPHLIYAYSVDAAGNRSDTATYLYYATRAQERDKPGDLNGDGFKDIWNTDTNGTLLTYAGRGNREFSSATNGGGTFLSQQVAFNGDWGQDGYNDLISLEYNENDNKNRLRVYFNNGQGIVDRDNYLTLTVSCPVPRPSGRCKGAEDWTGDDHWYNAEQVTTGGDLNGDTHADVLVKQGKNLWIYYGSRESKLDRVRPHPILVGEADWDKYTVIAPGDLNGDRLPDLILRDDASGDLYRSYGKADLTGALDPATWGNAASRVKIATGTAPKSLYPTIGTSGDLDGDSDADGTNDGDGIVDLWARKKDNTLLGWPGRKTGSDYTGIGSYFPIDGANGGRQIPAGTTLASGQALTSNTAKLTMQADGNLVITSNANQPLWTSGTSGNNGATARVLANGNIAVYSADGSTVLWSPSITADPAHPDVEPGLTGNGHALLQDRGNLVVYNGKAQAVWASGTVTRHDHNGDGRSDMGLWYDFTAGTDATYTMTANTDGSFQLPYKSFAAPAGAWEAKSMKFVTGDFNGDGRGDMAALYGYSDTSIKLWTALAKPDGGFATPFASWSVPKGTMHTSYMTPQAGDFNGDGRDDIAVWYAYPDGTSKLLTYTAGVTGAFNKPFESWSAPSGTWLRNRCKFVTGDFNGDGRDDIGVFYGQGDNSVRNHTFLSTVTGGFANPTSWWYSSALNWNLATPHAGDFSGDGRDDAMIWYDYADGSDKVSTFIAESEPDNHFGSAFVSLSSNAGNWDATRSQLVIGDYNGDGRDDIGAMHHQPDNSVKIWTWTSRSTDNKFNGALASWTYTASQWVYASTKFFKPYN
uniref:FG-GAP-like repeat-containing protein n=1 Tax=Streptomyces sp. NRRL S-325 TaxID=1463899 RepID=UPI000ACA7246|nr:FG-GAP-like repeat-containing protein [Streptomyces sp. NRRL S-325]